MIVRDIKKDVIGTSKEVFAKDGQWLSGSVQNSVSASDKS